MALLRLNRIRLIDMTPEYDGIKEGLYNLPIPGYIWIGFRRLHVPKEYKEFRDSLTYGQSLYMRKIMDTDYQQVINLISGYYYPLITGRWDADRVGNIGPIIARCKVVDLFPIAAILMRHVTELKEKESAILYREPSGEEKSAGIESLAPYNELMNIEYLADKMRMKSEEVLRAKYNECLVYMMLGRAMYDYQMKLNVIYSEKR